MAVFGAISALFGHKVPERPPGMPQSTTVLCIGAMLWDVIGHAPGRIAPGDDLPGRIEQRPGGVALNVAMALASHGLSPVMLAAVGRDVAGKALTALTESRGVDCRMLHPTEDGRTDSYMAIEDGTGMVASVADARALEMAGAAILAPLADGRLGSAAAPWSGLVLLDSNPAPEVIARFQSDPCLQAARLVVVPASPAKAARLAPLLTRADTSFYLNRAEAEVLAGRPAASARDAAEALIAQGARHVIVTDGPAPLAEGLAGEPTLCLSPPAVTLQRVTGAGDQFLAAHLKARIAGHDRAQALEQALAASTAYVSGKDRP